MSDNPILTIDGEVIGCSRAEVVGCCGECLQCYIFYMMMGSSQWS